jgi:hypothetical protein
MIYKIKNKKILFFKIKLEEVFVGIRVGYVFYGRIFVVKVEDLFGRC